MSSIPEPAPNAALWRRIGAGIYDLFPVLAIWMGIGFLVVGLRGFEAVPPYTWWFEALLLASAFAYIGWSWRHGGQTLGMRAWRIRMVVDGDGVPGWRLIGLRFVVMLLSVLAALLGVLWALVDPQRRMWHDLAAGTRVVRSTPAAAADNT